MIIYHPLQGPWLLMLNFAQAYVIHGMAMRLVISTGLHCIPSCVLSEKKTDSKHPLLRQRAYLFPPPEDRLELAERIHAL